MKWFFRMLLLITALTVIYLSAQPGEVTAERLRFIRGVFQIPSFVLGIPFRKVAHFVVFAVLGFFALLSMEKITLNRFFLLLMGIFIFAGMDEFHQSFIPKRIPDLRDVAIDFTGGYIGVAAAFILKTFWGKIFKIEKIDADKM